MSIMLCSVEGPLRVERQPEEDKKKTPRKRRVITNERGHNVWVGDFPPTKGAVREPKLVDVERLSIDEDGFPLGLELAQDEGYDPYNNK